VPHCARHTSSYGTGGSLSATPATWQRGLALAMELCEPALTEFAGDSDDENDDRQ